MAVGVPDQLREEGPAFAAKVPGHIVPALDTTGGHSYLVHRHGWLCGTPGITPSVGLQQSFRGGVMRGARRRRPARRQFSGEGDLL